MGLFVENQFEYFASLNRVFVYISSVLIHQLIEVILQQYKIKISADDKLLDKFHFLNLGDRQNRSR